LQWVTYKKKKKSRGVGKTVEITGGPRSAGIRGESGKKYLQGGSALISLRGRRIGGGGQLRRGGFDIQSLGHSHKDTNKTEPRNQVLNRLLESRGAQERNKKMVNRKGGKNGKTLVLQKFFWGSKNT